MTQSAQVIEYEQIFLGGRFFSNSGKIRFAEGGIGWKDGKTNAVTTIRGTDMRKMQWVRVSKGFQLRIVTKNGQVFRFDGFERQVMDELKPVFKRNYDLELELKEVSVRGWNWGRTDFQGSSLFFEVGNKPMLEVPLGQVASTAMASKNEVSVEFKLPTVDELADSASAKRGDQLVEMRFYIPAAVTDPAAKKPKLSADGETADGKLKTPTEGEADGMDVEDNDGSDSGSKLDANGQTEEEASAASAFYDMIKSKADIGMITGECIVPFHELPFVTPRGRYEVEMFGDFMRMHGKTYDYKIMYKHVKQLFLLPKSDDVHMLFVVSLDPPIRQGQTRYPFVIMQFMLDEELEVSLTISEEDLKNKFAGRLQAKYDAPTTEVVPSIFNVMTNIPLQVTDGYNGHFGAASIKCNMKANEGQMYPLKDCLLFIPKPCLHMPYTDISVISFGRVGGAAGVSKTFDMTVTMKKGIEHGFNNLAKEEFTLLETTLKSAGVRVKNDFSAEDMNIVDISSDLGSDEDAAPTARKAAKAANAVNALGDVDMDSDDESDDEDFVEEAESEVEEEYNENYESSGDDEEAEAKSVDKPAAEAED